MISIVVVLGTQPESALQNRYKDRLVLLELGSVPSSTAQRQEFANHYPVLHNKMLKPMSSSAHFKIPSEGSACKRDFCKPISETSELHQLQKTDIQEWH